MSDTTSIQTMVQDTPNPNAKKFIVNLVMRTDGKAAFNRDDEYAHVPIVEELFLIPSVKSVHLFDNFITVNQDGTQDWTILEEQVEAILHSLAGDHDPTFEDSTSYKRAQLSPELQKIEKILDETIRPYLQGDGGDLEVLELDNHVLTIRYQGACGSCPSAVTGTLYAIQSNLRDQFDPELEVVTV